MLIYYILLGLTAAAAYPLCRKCGTKGRVVYLFAVFGFMAVMASVRYGIGSDYFHYRLRMSEALDNGYGIVDAFRKVETEPGYSLIVMIIGAVFPRSLQYLALNIVMALISIVPCAYIIGRYSKMPWLSAWLYICITFFYNSMNFTRASAAAGIVFLAYPFMKEKKHLPVVLIILAACTFHLSAAVMLPVYFISLIKPGRIFTPAVSAAAVLLFVFLRQITGFAVSTVFTHYAHYLDSVYLNKGLDVPFIIVPAVIAAGTLAAYILGWKEREGSALLTNFAVYSFFIWLFSLRSFVLERFSLPVYIFLLISVPEILSYVIEKCSSAGKHAKKPLWRNAGVYATAAVYVLSLAYNMYTVSQGAHGVFPYRSIFRPAIVDEAKLAKYPRDCFVNVSFTSFLYTAGMRDYTVIAVKSGETCGNNDIVQQMYLKKLGLNLDLNDKSVKNYIGGAGSGSTAFEFYGDDRLEKTISLYDGKYIISLVSNTDKKFASVRINGREFITQGRGLFFVVFDNEKQVIATVQGYDLANYDLRYIHSDGFDGIWNVPGFEDFEVDLDF